MPKPDSPRCFASLTRLLTLGLLLSALCVGARPAVAEISADEAQRIQELLDNPKNGEMVRRLLRILEIVDSDYVEDVDSQALIDGAIEGMMGELDPYSVYLMPRKYKKWKESLKGAFGGLGIMIGIRNEILTVISPIEDTPAFRIGVHAGDQIIAIDGESTEGITVDEAVNILRGEAGTEVTITCYRPDTDEKIDFPIVREIIRIKPVKYQRLDHDIGYLKLTKFSETAEEEIRGALGTMKEEGPLHALIFDLRFNSGGLLRQAHAVSNIWLREGLVVYTEGRDGRGRREYPASAGDTEPDYPMIVLVNQGSASASEIVTGALQFHKRALILGVKTFGKGSVQHFFRMDQARNTAIKLTTKHYYLPSGVTIQDTGIEPDIVIEQPRRVRAPAAPENEAAESGDDRIREADLPGALPGEEGKDDGDRGMLLSKETIKNLETVGVRWADDNQLRHAVSILRGWEVLHPGEPAAVEPAAQNLEESPASP